MSDRIHPGERDPFAVPPFPDEGRTGAYGDGEPGLTLSAVFGALRRRKWLVARVTAVAVALSALIALQLAPQYTASGAVRITTDDEAVVAGLGGPAAARAGRGALINPIQSEVQLIRSRVFARRVIGQTALRLVSQEDGFPLPAVSSVSVDAEANPGALRLEFGEREYVARAGEEVARAPYSGAVALRGLSFTVAARPAVEQADLFVLPLEAGVDHYLEMLTTLQRVNTDIVDVSFTVTSPYLAQQLTNATLDEFRQYSAELARDDLRRRRMFIEAQLAETDAALSAARLALVNFQEREHVYSSQEWFVAQQEGLMQLNLSREEMNVERGMYANLLESLVSGEGDQGFETLVSVPGIAQNPVVASLYTQLVNYEAQRDSVTTGVWGSATTHPNVARLDGMIAATRDKLVRAIHSQISSLDARLAAMEQLRERTLDGIQELPKSGVEEVRLLQEVESFQSLAAHLRTEQQRAQLAEAVETGDVEIIDRAATPGQPVGNRRLLTLGLGLVLGLLIGTGGALMREQLNSSVTREDELAELLRLRTLAVIPPTTAQADGRRRLRIPAVFRNGNGRIRVADASGGPLLDGAAPEAEAFRTLRTSLLFSRADRPVRTLVVTSALPGEGKTTVASNLAVALTESGRTVLLVDADGRRGRLHEIFGRPREPGLTELLQGEVTAAAAIHPTAVPNLSLLGSGAPARDPSGALGGEAMASLIDGLQERFDVVVFDAPAVLAAADAAVLATMADGVALVVRAGQTDRAQARAAVQKLRDVGARVVGAVFNDPASTSAVVKVHHAVSERVS